MLDDSLNETHMMMMMIKMALVPEPAIFFLRLMFVTRFRVGNLPQLFLSLPGKLTLEIFI